SISSATWTNTGSFYIRVQGRNGASSPASYSLAVSTTGGPCSGTLDDRATDDTIEGSPGAAQTVILTDPGRMPGTAQEEAALDQALAALTARTDGVVIDVAGSAKVRNLNAQAASPAFVSCPYAKNLVAQAVRDIVNSYRDGQGTLKYVVVVGDDSVIPFFRYADNAGLGPESDYVPPVADSTASQASLRSNYVLSQDAYGAAVDISVKGSTLPIADVAVGRLVETPTEITGLVQDYLGRNGAPLRPASTLTTGYDFLTDAADSVAATFAAGVPGGTHDELITDANVPPTTTTAGGVPSRRTSWTATDLRENLFGSRHDLTFLAGHFSANSTLAADYDTTVLSTEVLQKERAFFQNSLIFSAGCHSGYTIVDGDGVPNVTVGLDWTQAFARQGATLIAGTGYQYGDTDFLEYSERLYADFARELRIGSAPVPVGRALATAKQSYLATTPNLRGIDQKSVLEATLYGLPMYAVDMPSRIPTPTDNSVATPSPVMTVPGSRLGLQVDNLAVNPMLQTVTKTLTNVDGGQVTATHLTGPDGVETNPSEPALPLERVNVSVPGQVLRGVGFRGGSYTDTDGITPLTGAPATETASVHTPFLSPAFFPPKLAVPNYFDVLGTAGDGTTRLMVTPAQHRSDATGSLTNTLRAYSGLGLRLYYSSNITTYAGNTPALAAAPSLTDIDATSQPDGSVTFQARAVGDPSAGIQEVWVTYTGERGSPLHGEWASLDLTQDPVDSTLWTGSLTPQAGQDPAEIRYVVQAANGVGLVGMDDNQGVYFTPGVTAGAVDPDAVATTLSLGGVSPSATYGANLPVSATLTGAGGAPVAGQLVTFTLGSASRSAVTNGSGRAATELPLNVVPGEPYKLTASFDGDAALASSASAAVTVAVSKQPTALTLTRDATGALTATLVGNTGLALREKTVFFAATDRGGAVLTGSVVITDQQGTAQLNAAQVPTAATAVTAYFGSASTPLPGGDTADLADPSYAPSTSTRVGLPGAPTAVADAYSV
ncbi:MAG: Ig-like domain repeat protein, partial [Actinomycetota bacterium]|nr:Ig-like domain repeat protein [Actinomycetota bacterium]